MTLSNFTLIRLQHQHELALDYTKELTEEKIKQKPQPNKWSILNNLQHLACYQEFFIERIDRILKEDNPQFNRYIPEEDPEFVKWLDYSFDKTVKRLKESRIEIIGIIEKLNDETLKRTGSHPVVGTLTLAKWIEMFLLHEGHHLYTIWKLAHSQ